MIRLQSTYFSPPGLISRCLDAGGICLEAREFFQKQSYRNRTVILGPNGLQPLIVPVQGRNQKQYMDEVRISYAEPWQRVHLNALQTAYRSAPYFEHLYDEIEAVLKQNHEKLIDLNTELLKLLLRKLRIKKEISFSTTFEIIEGERDERNLFHPKRDNALGIPYPQVFQEKFGFVSGAGVLDLMMNDLSGASDYLRRLPR